MPNPVAYRCKSRVAWTDTTGPLDAASALQHGFRAFRHLEEDFLQELQPRKIYLAQNLGSKKLLAGFS